MKMTIYRDASHYSRNATTAECDEIIDWMRKVADLLCMNLVGEYMSGTDKHHEVWATCGVERKDDIDVGGKAFLCLVFGDSPAETAKEIMEWETQAWSVNYEYRRHS